LRKAAGEDLFAFIVLRCTGLRVSDAMHLTSASVHFDRGANGEIEVVTQKRGKKTIIPLSSELNDALQTAFHKPKPQPGQHVLINPDTAKPFTSVKALGIRAGVTRVHPHCFRDTFVGDMLARGTSSYVVGQMVADTTETLRTSRQGPGAAPYGKRPGN
jgi:integrase